MFILKGGGVIQKGRIVILNGVKDLLSATSTNNRRIGALSCNVLNAKCSTSPA